MKGKIKFLGAALVVQLVLTTYIVFQPRVNQADTAANAALLNLVTANIDEIQITGAEDGTTASTKNSTLTMRDENGKWVLPNYQNFAAQPEKVAQLLEKLSHLKRGWVVANSQASADRFKVKADDFSRKLVFLSQGKPVQTLLIGTTPRFKYTHVRVGTEDNIYEVPFGVHEVSIAAQDWINAAYLHSDLNGISNVVLPSLKLSRDASKEGQFTVTSIDPDKLDKGKLETLLYRLTHLSLQDIISATEKNEIEALAPKFTYSVQFKVGNTVDYKIYELKNKPYYVLVCSGDTWSFRVDKHTIDEIATVKLDNLVIKLSAASEGKDRLFPDEKLAQNAE